MQARTLRIFAALLVAACSGDVTQPPRSLGTTPSSAISDGASGGNTEFWFLSPMVPDPSGNPLYLDNGFNPSLTPMATITKVPGGEIVLGPTAAPLIVNKSQYQLDWKVPATPNPQSYRIRVTLGATELGFADVTASSKGKVAGTGFIPVAFGTTLPIKFVIEGCALVADECSAKTVNTAQGGTVETDEGGVTIPPQPSGQKVLVTVTSCPDIPTDLPRKSDCIRVTTIPPLAAPLTIPATVWVCGVPAAPLGSQEERYTMYRYDALPSPTTTALPHAHDECDPPVVGDAGGSLRGVLADLVRGRLKSAGRQLASMLGPRALYATAMLDVGAGGETEGFSDFQLVLPGSMTKCAGDGATGGAGFPIAAKVCVTDVGGGPVEGATVHFVAGNGSSVSAASAVTNSAGEAAVDWTLALGANSLTASGNGIGGSDNNGPRTGVDPFQALSTHFGDGSDGDAVPVLTGSVVFSATGVAEPVDAGLFGFGSGGWSFKELSQSAGGPTNWYLPTFNAQGGGFTFNQTAPFGSRDALSTGVCPALSFGTAWVTGNDILARKLFSIATPGNVEIRVAVDNDLVEIWLNGVQLNATIQTHEGCADPGTVEDMVFSGTTIAGTNLIAIRARDRGSVAYLDARITVAPTIP